VLVNALYFKSEFEKEFDDELSGTFETTFGDVNVDVMTSDNMSVGLDESTGDATVVAIPFKDNGFYMVLVMPKKGMSPLDMLRGKNSEELMYLVTHPDQLENVQVALKVPKFNVTMGNELTGMLSSLPGLAPAFGQNADYSRMTKQRVKIGNVNHKATIEVNKNGVEASAATSISVVLYSLFTPEKNIEFDRPFAYFIVEDGKAIHMAGILNNPNEV